MSILNNYDSTVTVTKVVLEKIRKQASMKVGAFTSQSMEMTIAQSIDWNGWIASITADLLATKLAEDKYKAHFYYKVPSSWFQMFKKERYPKWLLAKYPVRYTSKSASRTVHFKRYETYPLANLAVPKDQRTIEILGYDRPITDVVWVD